MTIKAIFVRSLTYSNLLLETSLPFPRAFAGQNIMSFTSQPKAFILDFDGTITEKDTIDALGKIGVEWQARRGVDMKEIWDEVVKAYGRDFAGYVGANKLVKENRTTVPEEVRYLRALREIEERSLERVSRSGVFRGMGKEDWERAGRSAVGKRDVVVRNGFKEFLERIKQDEILWGIVSVNFSGSFIRGVVEASAGSDSEGIEVLANEFDETGVLFGPGSVSGRIIATSDAKMASMKDLLKSWSDRETMELSKPVYVGDSGTDIECLTDPDVVGIAMSDAGPSSLIQTLQRIGVAVVPIEAYKQDEPSGRRVYRARDFHEILRSPLFTQR